MTGYESKRAAARDKLDGMEREALKLALEALKIARDKIVDPEYHPIGWDVSRLDEVLFIGKQALAQPAQEPWRESASDYERGVIDGREMQAKSSVDKAVNAMALRPWVGLTDEQIADYLGDEYHAMTESELRFFRLGEAAAKEKNTWC